MARATWTIAEIAEEFGITHRTVRYYESEGLISPERRGTIRVFHPRDRVRLGLVLRGRRIGFQLEEIRKIVDMYDDVPGESGQLDYLLTQIDDRRQDLQRRRADIDAALTTLCELEHRCREDLRALQGAAHAPRSADPGGARLPDGEMFPGTSSPDDE